MDIVREITLKRHPIRHPVPRPGDSVKVSIRVREGGKERIQIFEGVVLKSQGSDYCRSITVRKISHGIGVEKTLPLASPNIAGIEIISHAKVRRARLYYLRQLKGRAARLKAKGFSSLAAAEAAPPKADSETDKTAAQGEAKTDKTAAQGEAALKPKSSEEPAAAAAEEGKTDPGKAVADKAAPVKTAPGKAAPEAPPKSGAPAKADKAAPEKSLKPAKDSPPSKPSPG